MGYLSRIKNRLITRAATRFPALRDHLVRSYQAWEAKDTPWTPVAKPLARCTIAMDPFRLECLVVPANERAIVAQALLFQLEEDGREGKQRQHEGNNQKDDQTE